MASLESPSAKTGQKDEAVETDFYDILLVGRTGQGKSSTGNLLLGINKESGAEKPDIKEWTSEGPQVSKPGDAHFVTGGSVHSITSKCRLLSNHQKVRVLDTPGFADTKVTAENGVFLGNLGTFRCIIGQQKAHDLAFRRVLYFLPHRGTPERAEGTLQEEIKVMYGFVGMDIFNIMVIIATQSKKKAHQDAGFDDEDKTSIEKAFTEAFKLATKKDLPQCPPIIYLPINKTSLIDEIKDVKVISTALVKYRKPSETAIAKLMEINPGKKLNFQKRCIRCACELIFERPIGEERKVVGVINEKGIDVSVKDSACHPIFIPKHTTIKKIVGGVAHVATLGIPLHVANVVGCKLWPGFTNSDEICPVCKRSPGSRGCMEVNSKVDVGEDNWITIKHNTELDKIQSE